MNLSLVKEHINPDFVIDVGACSGSFYKEAKELWPNATFWLIEANMECSEMLESLNIDFTIAVLSDREKVVTFYTRKDSPCATGNSYYLENTIFYQGDEAVPHKVHTKTLDVVCSHLELKNKKVLLKLDSQGSELDILKGGKVVLRSCDAVIVEVSYANYNQGAPLATEVDQYMRDNGFEQVATLERLVHPITQTHIQDSVLYV